MKILIKFHHYLFWGLCTFFFVVPFFWMKPGELDIGGDGTKMFFYDPVSFLKYSGLFITSSAAHGEVNPQFYYIPLASTFALLNIILHNTSLINVLHISLKLVMSFIAMYLVTKRILTSSYSSSETNNFTQKVEYASIVTGVGYILAPTIIKFNSFVDAVITHDQVFLNPLIFFCIIEYIITKKIKYLWVGLLVSLIFSHNFAYHSAPGFFAFYPMVILFLLVYVKFLLKIQLPLLGIAVGFIFFITLHAFHLIPEFLNILTVGSNLNTQIFSGSERRLNIDYFYGVLFLVDFPGNILMPSLAGGFWNILSLLNPLVITLGLYWNTKRNKSILLISVFFLISLFFLSPKVGDFSIKTYIFLLENVPGFLMFRNVQAQWLYVYSFFYMLLFGSAFFILLQRFKNKQFIFPALGLIIYFIGSAWIFLNGDLFNYSHQMSANVGKRMIMDPTYEKMLHEIRQLPKDSKILHFPFSDFNYQVIHGTGNGAFVGNSSIGQLTGRKDVVGYWHVAPYSDLFLQASKEKNYVKIQEILGLLNIGYLLHNTDEKIYDTTFPERPYGYVRQFMPNTQKEYGEFIKPLIDEEIFRIGSYRLYSLKNPYFLPHMYTPEKMILYQFKDEYNKTYNESSSYLLDNFTSKRPLFIEKSECLRSNILKSLCDKKIDFSANPNISFKRVNPTRYEVKISNITKPFILVMSDTFSPDWSIYQTDMQFNENGGEYVYFDGDIRESKVQHILFEGDLFDWLTMDKIGENSHFIVNGYANAWYIDPEEIENKKEVTFILQPKTQRIFYISSVLSLISFTIFLLWGVFIFLSSQKQRYTFFWKKEKVS